MAVENYLLSVAYSCMIPDMAPLPFPDKILPLECTVIVTGGEVPEAPVALAVLQRATLVLVADSGLEACQSWGIVPDFVLGDFDSVAPTVLQTALASSIVERAPSDKDLSDTELALSKACELSESPLVLLGGGGGRGDHYLSLVALFRQDRFPCVWITRSETVVPLSAGEELELDGMAERTLSVVPILEESFVESEGLVWELGAQTFKRFAMSLSNRISGPSAKILSRQGRVLVFLANT